MSRKYREWKSDMKIAHIWGYCLDCKRTLSLYKKIKRKIQRNKKNWNKFRRSLRKGAVLVISGKQEKEDR